MYSFIWIYLINRILMMVYVFTITGLQIHFLSCSHTICFFSLLKHWAAYCFLFVLIILWLLLLFHICGFSAATIIILTSVLLIFFLCCETTTEKSAKFGHGISTTILVSILNLSNIDSSWPTFDLGHSPLSNFTWAFRYIFDQWFSLNYLTANLMLCNLDFLLSPF